MPKSTFHSLCGEKKQRLIDAALEEFSRRTFSQASLNQIIKQADIPKGSFYQYFENKEDLYLYLAEAASGESKRLLAGIEMSNPGTDAFEAILRTTEQSFRQTNIDPRYTAMALLTMLDDSDFIRGIRERRASERNTIRLLEQDKARGLIKPEVDCELVANLISAFSLRELIRSGKDTEAYLKNLRAAVKLIQEGVSL